MYNRNNIMIFVYGVKYSNGTCKGYNVPVKVETVSDLLKYIKPLGEIVSFWLVKSYVWYE